MKWKEVGKRILMGILFIPAMIASIFGVIVLILFIGVISINNFFRRGVKQQYRDKIKQQYCDKWTRHGKPILFVQSRSLDDQGYGPHWEAYINEILIPMLQAHAIVLDCSKQGIDQEQFALEKEVIQCFCSSPWVLAPAVIYLPIQGKVEVISFGGCFILHDKGREGFLKKAEQQLSDILDQLQSS